MVKKIVITPNAAEDAEKLNHSSVAMGTQNGTGTLEKNMVISHKTKPTIIFWAFITDK